MERDLGGMREMTVLRHARHLAIAALIVAVSGADGLARDADPMAGLGMAAIRATLLEGRDPPGGASLDEVVAALEARDDNPQILHVLGLAFAGDGVVEPDADRAIRYLEAAADAGHVGALQRLARLFENDTLVPADAARALAYRERAVAAGQIAAAVPAARLLISGGPGLEPDTARAERLLEIAAQAGDDNAVRLLDRLRAPRPLPFREIRAALLDGEPAPEGASVEEMIAALEAMEGNGSALFVLGSAFLGESPDVARDVDRGIGFLERAAAEGNPHAAIRLARLFEDGTLVEEDAARALAFYERAIDIGGDRAVLPAARLLANGGPGLEPDSDRAVALLEPLAGQGDEAAERLLARLTAPPRLPLGAMRAALLDGEPAPQGASVEEMIAALEAMEDDAGALFVLGRAFAGEGVLPADPARALPLLERAADLGNVGAMLRLARIHDEGELVARDAGTALTWFERAVAAGQTNVAMTAARLALAGGPGLEPSVDRAVPLLEAAADAGSTDAQVRLADIYLGPEGPNDPAAAIAKLQAAADAGDGRAAMALGRLYRNGGPVRADATRALAAFERARALGVDAAAVQIFDMRLSAGRRDVRRIREASAALEREAQAGNAAAILRLVNFQRTGVGRLVPGSRSAAMRTLEAGRAALSPAAYQRELAILELAGARSLSEIGEIQALLDAAEPRDRVRILRASARANPNAFVYFVQARLLETGHLDGRVTGLLDTRTIRAINRFCVENDAAAACRTGPLSGPAVRFLSETL